MEWLGAALWPHVVNPIFKSEDAYFLICDCTMYS